MTFRSQATVGRLQLLRRSDRNVATIDRFLRNYCTIGSDMIKMSWHKCRGPDNSLCNYCAVGCAARVAKTMPKLGAKHFTRCDFFRTLFWAFYFAPDFNGAFLL